MADRIDARIVGIWQLVDAKAVDGNGRPAQTPYGGYGMGLVTLAADGRMMAVLCDGRASLPASTAREYNSYCGNYRFDGETLVTRVDACSNPARMGTDQVRKVRFHGNRMVLEPPPGEVDGRQIQRELTWERVS